MSLFRTEKQKMLAGELYHANDAELEADRSNASAWRVRYNAALTTSDADRRALLRELLAEAGDGAVIRSPFYCNYYCVSNMPHLWVRQRDRFCSAIGG